MSERIYNCSLDALDIQLVETGATRLISLLNSEIMIETPGLIKTNNHLRLTMSDIDEPMDGRILPEREHIEQLITFANSWNRTTPMLIHCLAGISRSTAATFITLCTLNPEISEIQIARTLRKASPTAHPNRLLIELGDSLLKRDGKMIGAIENLGLGTIETEGDPFSLPAKFLK